MKLTPLVPAFALLGISFSSSAEDIERITVSADLSQRDLSELPASVLVIDEEVIELRESRHLQDLIATMPNVNFSAGATRGKFIQIRGIGERSQFSEPTNPSVGLLLDDLDISGLGSLATTFDLQQVELLSGPQSVASGVNSLAGVIKLVSNDAGATNKLGLSIAEFGEWQVGAAGTVEVTDDVSIRLSLQNTQSDGFVENQFLMRDDTNGVDELTANATLFFTIDDSSSLQASLYRFDINNGYDAFSLDNDSRTRSDEPGFDNTDAHAVSVKYSKKFGDLQLQTVISRLDGDFDYGYDEDWTFIGFHPFEYSSFDRYFRTVERNNVSIKLADDTDEKQQWLAGISYFSNEESLLREYTFNAADFTSEYDPSSTSIFGQYTWQLSDDVALVTAARLESFSADYSDNDGFVESLDDTLFAGSVELQYDIGSNLFYSSVSRGYKAGGFNIDQRLSGDNRTYSPEYNWNIEAGIRGIALDGKAQLGVGVFYMKRTDAQVNDFATFEQITDDGSTITSFADAIRNTDTGTNRGIELNSTWFIAPTWTMKVNAGYLDATFGNYNRLDGSFVPEQDQAQAPEFTVYASSTFEINDAWSWFIDVDAKDEYRFSDGHNERAPFTVVVNTNVTYQIGKSTISLWVKNIFDRTVFTRGFGGFSNDPRDEYAFVEPYYQFGQPRQVGASYTYSF